MREYTVKPLSNIETADGIYQLSRAITAFNNTKMKHLPCANVDCAINYFLESSFATTITRPRDSCSRVGSAIFFLLLLSRTKYQRGCSFDATRFLSLFPFFFLFRKPTRTRPVKTAKVIRPVVVVGARVTPRRTRGRTRFTPV